MSGEKEYKTLGQFWPFYLGEHASRRNRILHFVGTSLVILTTLYAVGTQQWMLLIVVPFWGYGFAWVGHFIVEKNRPATFKYPFKSLASDFIMYYYMISGQIGRQIQLHGIVEKP